MRRWWSGLSQQTVNLSPSGFVGSNPTRRTKLVVSIKSCYYKTDFKKALGLFCFTKVKIFN